MTCDVPGTSHKSLTLQHFEWLLQHAALWGKVIIQGLAHCSQACLAALHHVPTVRGPVPGLDGCKSLCSSQASHGVQSDSTEGLPASATGLALHRDPPAPWSAVRTICAHRQAWSPGPLLLLAPACRAPKQDLSVSAAGLAWVHGMVHPRGPSCTSAISGCKAGSSALNHCSWHALPAGPVSSQVVAHHA